MHKALLLVLVSILLARPCLVAANAPLPAPGLNLADSPLVATSPLPLATPAPQVFVFPAIPAAPAPAAAAAAVTGWVNVLYTVVPILAGAVLWLWSQFGALKERMDRQSLKTGQLQDQVTNNARALPPAPVVSAPPDPSSAKAPLVPLLLLGALGMGILAGCAGSRADLDFRRKVQSGSIAGRATPSEYGYGGEIVGSLVFRDPSKEMRLPVKAL